jgi:hypothetical protein
VKSASTYALDEIGPEDWFSGDQSQIIGQCLRDQESIKRVFVLDRQRFKRDDM